MDGAVVEFDALADADGAGAEDHHRAFALGFHFIFRAVGGVVVRSVGFKFSGAGIYHFEIGVESQFLFEIFHFLYRHFCKVGDGFIRHLDPFDRFQGVFGEAFLQEASFHFDNILDFIDEEEVDAGNAVDFFRFDAAAEGFGHHEDSFIIDALQKAADIIEGLAVQFLQVQIPLSHFQGPEGLEECPFQGAVQGHHFAGGLHLGADFTVRQGEFFKRPAGEFADHIVDGRFEAGLRIAGNGIGDFIQMHAQGYLGCHFGDRIAGGFGCQGGGTAHAGIHFDHIVLVRLGVQAVLHVAAPFDLEVADDIDGGGAEHLVLAVSQSLGGGHYDGVAGMDAYGVDVFHGADNDAVVGAVPHNFKLHFLPSCNGPFHQDLVDRRKLDAAVGDFFHFIPVMGNAAAGAAQGVGGADDDRIADFIRKSHGRFQFFKNFRFRYGLVDFFHGFLEKFPVLRMFDGMEGGAQKLHVVFFQHSCFGELYCHVEAHLAAQGSQQGIRSFFLNDFRHKRQGNRFDVDPVCNVHVRHNGGRIAVYQDHFHPLFPKGAAGLGAGVVKFRCLADDDGAGTDDKDFLHVFINHFLNSSMALVNSAKR